MRIIAWKKLREYVDGLAGKKEHDAVLSAVEAWYEAVKSAHWQSSADVKARFATASIINAERIVFNIKGNDYRLIVAVNFEIGIVWTKWIGTHADYDHVDAATVDHDD